MPIIDLQHRVTHDPAQYTKSLRSDDSLILITPQPDASAIEAGSVDLTMGDRIFDPETSSQSRIAMDGIVLRAGRSIIVYTAEKVCVPFNVFGFISGKGRLIYNGIFVSQGKIDPGFQNNLRLILYNSGRKSVQLTPGMRICSCSFVQMQTHIQGKIGDSLQEPVPSIKPGWVKVCLAFCTDNWKWIVTTCIAAIAAFAGALRAYLSIQGP